MLRPGLIFIMRMQPVFTGRHVVYRQIDSDVANRRNIRPVTAISHHLVEEGDK